MFNIESDCVIFRRLVIFVIFGSWWISYGQKQLTHNRIFYSVYITVADVRKQLPLPFLHESMFSWMEAIERPQSFSIGLDSHIFLPVKPHTQTLDLNSCGCLGQGVLYPASRCPLASGSVTDPGSAGYWASCPTSWVIHPGGVSMILWSAQLVTSDLLHAPTARLTSCALCLHVSSWKIYDLPSVCIGHKFSILKRSWEILNHRIST